MIPKRSFDLAQTKDPPFTRGKEFQESEVLVRIARCQVWSPSQ